MVYDIISLTTGGSSLAGIISFDAVSANDYYRNMLLPAFKRKPFYFKPLWSGSATPLGGLEFRLPQTISNEPELESKIDPANQANRRYYDGKKLFAILLDEQGKTQPNECDIIDGWGVLIPTLTQGGGTQIHGYALSPSTAEDIDTGGGRQYLELSKMSNYYRRNKTTGQTKSGLCTYFIPSQDGLQGFIGKYGESIIDDPTPEQADFIGKNHGARESLMSKRDELSADTSMQGMDNYRSFVRKFPMCFDDCFIGNSSNIGFNVKKCDDRISELNRMESSPVVTGNFEWLNNVPDSSVIFNECSDGRFEVSKILRQGESNQKKRGSVWDNVSSSFVDAWQPDNPRCCAGADPFKWGEKSAKQISKKVKGQSNGGGAVVQLRDRTVDTDDIKMCDWKTYNIWCTYQARTLDEGTYAEDMLKMCTYYGAMMFPECNVPLVWKHFKVRGYAGYLLYDIDTTTNKRKEFPGFHSTNEVKENLFSYGKDFIEHRIWNCDHKSFIEDCKAIRGIDDMTNYDRLTAVFGALKGANSLAIRVNEKRITSDSQKWVLDDFR
jgi:hypothetical protein